MPLAPVSRGGGWLHWAARVGAALCALALLMSCLPVVSSGGGGKAAGTVAATASAGAAGDYVLLIFERSCYERYLRGDFFDVSCLKTTVSKLLGYGIIAGACIVKLPQIIGIVVQGSSEGLSLESTYFELIGYLLQSTYHIVNGSPISAYGEALVVTAQSIGLVLLLWFYRAPSALHASAIVAGFALLTEAGRRLMLEPGYSLYVQSIVTGLFIISRAIQIADVYRLGTTGVLSPLTLLMNFAGSAARIYTSAVEVNDRPEVFWSCVISTALNGVLIVQFIYYFLLAPKPQAPAPAAAALPIKSAGTSAANEASVSDAAAPLDNSEGATRSAPAMRSRRHA